MSRKKVATIICICVFATCILLGMVLIASYNINVTMAQLKALETHKALEPPPEFCRILGIAMISFGISFPVSFLLANYALKEPNKKQHSRFTPK